MADLPPKVAPGDLILANHLNAFVDYLTDLETRVAVLEAGGGPGGKLTVLGLSPSDGVHMGQELRVIGQGFGIPALNIVTIGSATIQQFKVGSNANVLIFDVPPIPSTPATGIVIPLTVSGPNGFDDTTVRILPAVPDKPAGSLMVTYQDPPPVATLGDDDSFIFTYAVRATVNMTETYVVETGLSGSPAGWNAALVNDAGTAIVPPRITVDVGSPPSVTTQTFKIRVVIPLGATAADLNVRLVAERNPELAGEKNGIHLAVGQAPPAPGPIHLFLNPGDVLPPGEVVGGVLQVPAGGGLAFAPFSALIATAGTYVIQDLLVEDDPSNRWTAALGVSTREFTTSADNQVVSIPVGIQAASGAPDAVLVVSVEAKGNSAINDVLRQPLALP